MKVVPTCLKTYTLVKTHSLPKKCCRHSNSSQFCSSHLSYDDPPFLHFWKQRKQWGKPSIRLTRNSTKLLTIFFSGQIVIWWSQYKVLILLTFLGQNVTTFKIYFPELIQFLEIGLKFSLILSKVIRNIFWGEF